MIGRGRCSISIRRISAARATTSLFGREQFAIMAERLRRLKGKLILSINDNPAIREIFAGFEQHEAELTYSVAGGEGMPARELIIRGA